jgi:hypothetical protein
MSFSSNVGIIIPNKNISPDVLIEIYESIDNHTELGLRRKSIGREVREDKVIRKLIFLKKIIKIKKYKTIQVDDQNYKLTINEMLGNEGFVSPWYLPNDFNKILLNGEAELKNNKLWTPESVSIECSNGICSVNTGSEDDVHIVGAKINLWGYGYFFPYSFDEVIEKMYNNETFNCSSIQGYEGETGFIRNDPKWKLPIYAEQSL